MQLSQILISALLACTVAGTSHNYKEMKDKGITGPTTTPPTQSPVPTPGSKEYKNKAPKVKTMKTKTKAPKAKPTKSKSSKGSKSTSKSGGGKSGGGGKGGSGSGSGSKNGTTGGGGSSGGNSASFPTAVGSVIVLSAPQSVTGSFDGGLKEYDRGQPCNSDADTGSANAVFILESGATLSNVIIGADQLEGVHCKGPCTLKNVWFRDVCEGKLNDQALLYFANHSQTPFRFLVPVIASLMVVALKMVLTRSFSTTVFLELSLLRTTLLRVGVSFTAAVVTVQRMVGQERLLSLVGNSAVSLPISLV